ncbi:hypothetical protein COLO4_03556 [Corchorus olitorius]|uniref:Uncharacterized protein n=1 Tax=Corchorus olitorius TaxID=93759 RepID=A0A1R3KY28_9ROSI|nr:hypothetical protein COLO4_03556 [Corchorus olitorius]
MAGSRFAGEFRPKETRPSHLSSKPSLTVDHFGNNTQY